MNFTKEEEKRLMEEYPFAVRKEHWYTGEPVEEEFWTLWVEDIPDGWWKAFGEDLLKELKELLIKYDMIDDYKIEQIKEKFGGLRWYDHYPFNEDFYEEHILLMSKYEKKSYDTCINCGEPADFVTTGWISPFCKNCIKLINSTYEEIKK